MIKRWRGGYVDAMRKTLMVLFAVLSLAGAAACGNDADNADNEDESSESGAGEQLTKEEFLERGDAICGELDVALGLVEFPKDQNDFARYLKEVRGPAEAAREDLELLVPPDDGEDVHQALLDQFTSGLESLDGAITAAEAGDTVTAGDLLAEADRDGDEVDTQLQAYGFKECGVDDVDEEGGSGDDEPLPEGSDPQPNDPQRDDEPLPEEQDPEPNDPEPNG